MARTLPLCALLFLLPCAARADDAPAQTIVRLTVTPQPAPTPALRYQLLPQLREMNPGNPVQGFLTCFMEQNNLFYDKTAVENRERWLTMPLKDLPVKELHDYGWGGSRQADYAARLDKIDWQILPRMRRDGFSTLLPDVQVLRRLADVLKVRLRAAVAERRFDDALVTAKTMFALSRCLGQHPALVGDLVGLAVASMAVDPLEEMIKQPGCPNLYWALTDLPTPFIDFREGRQGQQVIDEAEFSVLDDKAPMSDGQIQKALDKLRAFLQLRREWGFKDLAVKLDPAVLVAAWAMDADLVSAARKRLIASGLSEEKVKQFPAQQVIMLDKKLDYEIERDEESKILALPYWEVEKLRATAPKEKQGESLLGLLRPSFINARMMRQTAARLDQRLALLRCVEALRIYAAENDGKLPAKLSDVKLPLPVDPVTGKSFPYQLDGATATLRGTPPAGREGQPGYDMRYEVTIAK